MIVRKTYELTRATGTGWCTALALPELGRRGRIQRVIVRLDNVENDAQDATFYIADGLAAATPADDDVAWTGSASMMTGSATTAALNDPQASGEGYYDVAALGDLKLNANITMAGSITTTKLHVTVIAEVET